LNYLRGWVLRDGRGRSRTGRGEQPRPGNDGGDDADRGRCRERDSYEPGPRSQMPPSGRLPDASYRRSGAAPAAQDDVGGLKLGVERGALAREQLRAGGRVGGLGAALAQWDDRGDVVVTRWL
jgi:hypothetical protein